MYLKTTAAGPRVIMRGLAAENLACIVFDDTAEKVTDVFPAGGVDVTALGQPAAHFADMAALRAAFPGIADAFYLNVGTTAFQEVDPAVTDVAMYLAGIPGYCQADKVVNIHGPSSSHHFGFVMNELKDDATQPKLGEYDWEAIKDYFHRLLTGAAVQDWESEIAMDALAQLGHVSGECDTKHLPHFDVRDQDVANAANSTGDHFGTALTVSYNAGAMPAGFGNVNIYTVAGNDIANSYHAMRAQCGVTPNSWPAQAYTMPVTRANFALSYYPAYLDNVSPNRATTALHYYNSAMSTDSLRLLCETLIRMGRLMVATSNHGLMRGGHLTLAAQELFTPFVSPPYLRCTCLAALEDNGVRDIDPNTRAGYALAIGLLSGIVH